MSSTLSFMCHSCIFFFFFKQKTAYEMRISDWSSDVCSSDLRKAEQLCLRPGEFAVGVNELAQHIVGDLRAPQRHARNIGDKPPAHFHDRDARVGVKDADVGRRHDLAARTERDAMQDRKSTRLNSSH